MLYQEHNQPIRTLLRFLGVVLLLAGVIFAIIGLVDFFAAFNGNSGPPTKFWCAFVGLPLIGIGVSCLKAGYLRTIGKYVAGESVPIVTESARHVVRGLQPELQEYRRGGSPAGSSTPTNAVVRLKELEQLKQKNLISKAEYEEKRRQIINKL